MSSYPLLILFSTFSKAFLYIHCPPPALPIPAIRPHPAIRERTNFRLGKLLWAQQLYLHIHILASPYNAKSMTTICSRNPCFLKKKLPPPLPFMRTSHPFSTHRKLAPASAMLLSKVSSKLHACYCPFLICPHEIWYCCSLTHLWTSVLLHFWNIMLFSSFFSFMDPSFPLLKVSILQVVELWPISTSKLSMSNPKFSIFPQILFSLFSASCPKAHHLRFLSVHPFRILPLIQPHNPTSFFIL